MIKTKNLKKIGMAGLSLLATTPVIAEAEYYFRYPVAVEAYQEYIEKLKESCGAGMTVEQGRCVFDFDQEESNTIWREFADTHEISKENVSGEFHQYIQSSLGSEVTSLPSALYPLDIISGSISLQNSGITDVDGFGMIQYIGGGLYLGSNNISSIFGLSNLTQIEDNLALNNNNLSSLDALQNLVSVSGIDVENNNNLAAINLPSLSGQLDFLDFSNTVKEVSIPAVSNIDSLNGSNNSFVEGNLEEVLLPSLGNQVGRVYMRNNNISELDLSSLTDIDVISLNGNSLEDLSGVRNLTSVNSAYFYDNNIKTIDGLSNLVNVDNILNLKNNDITDTNGLVNLSSVGRFFLDGNSRLTSIALPSLSGYVGEIVFDGTVEELFIPNVTNIGNLSDSPSSSFIGGNLTKVSLPSLTNSSNRERVFLQNNQISELDLSSLTDIDILYLSGNNLEDLSGISSLSVANKVYVESNPLQNLDGIANLSSGELYISAYSGSLLPAESVFCTSPDTYLFIDRNSTPKSSICL